MQILEAFRALRALDEDVFDLSNVEELSDFMSSDDIEDEVKVIDPEAEFEDDLQDSYVGKVIIDCCVCHSKLYKDKSEVVLDDAGEFANVGEECPYCFTSDGFKVIGEVAAFGASDNAEEKSEESEEETSDSEINDEEEINENFDKNHSLTEENGKRVLAPTVQKGTKLAGLSGEAEIVTDKKQNGNQITFTTKTKLGQPRNYTTLTTDDVEVFGADASVGETVDEGLFDKFKKNKKPDFYSKEEIEKRRKANQDRMQAEKEKREEEERQRAADAADSWARRDRAKRDAEREYQRSLSGKIAGDKPSNTGHRGIGYSGGDYYSESLEEAAFSGGMAGDNSASGGTVRGRGASTQPSKNNYLGRLKSKNADLVDIITVKGKDIKPGMITQAGQVKEAELDKNGNKGKVYIMHTNNYDGFWDADEDMEVLADPENKSKPFAGEYRSLLKMGLTESIEDLSMTANNTHLDITEDETGKVTVSMGPADSAEEGEMIAPLSDETETEIMSNTAEAEEDSLDDEEDVSAEEEIDMEIDDLDDESMNELGEAYLKRVYENVQNYKVTGVKTHGNNLIIEGNIKFSNNSVRKSNFIFEAYSTDGKGKVTFKGRNEITGSKNAFTLTGTLKDNNLKLESLTYNYRTLTEGKSNRVYGQIRL